MIQAALPQTHDPIRAMYRRYLASWAMDLLELRRRGLDRPGRREGSESSGPVSPGFGADAPSPAPVRPFLPMR